MLGNFYLMCIVHFLLFCSSFGWHENICRYVLEIHPQSSAATTSFHNLVYIQTGTNVAARHQETWSIAPKNPQTSEENDGELHTQEHVI